MHVLDTQRFAPGKISVLITRVIPFVIRGYCNTAGGTFHEFGRNQLLSLPLAVLHQ